MEKLIPRREESNFNPVIKVNELGVKSPRELPPVQALLNAKHHKKIVKRIFRGNPVEFLEFLKSVDPVSNWKEAFLKAESELQKRNIRPEIEEATLLMNIIYRRYYPADDEIEIG